MSILFTGTQEGRLGASLPVLPAATYASALLDLNPLIYYKMDETSGTTLADSSGNAHDADISGTVGYSLDSLVRGETTGTSFDYAGAGYSELAHEAALDLSALTISLWFQLNDLPDVETADQYIFLSKDASGLSNGDFVVGCDNDGILYAHFQDTSGSYRVESPFVLDGSAQHHVAVTADGSGFALWHNGQKVDTSASYLGAWSENTRDLQIGHVAWQTGVYANARIDEVAIFDSVLSDANILVLARQSDPPIAGAASGSVLEQETVEIDVLAKCKFVGDPDNVTIAIASQGSDGTYAVTVDNTVEYTADDISASLTDTDGSYRITDVNGTSTPAGLSVAVTAAGSGGGGDDGFGGTLVFDWQPSASWIDGVSLANRHYNQNPGGVADIDRWTGGASVGSSLIKGITPDVSTGNGDVCWNRAPTGDPSLEVWAKSGTGGGSNVLGFYIHLFDAFQGTPKHCRVVVEVMNCLSSNPTTYKSAGVGTTSGSYPDFEDSFYRAPPDTGSTCKYPCGMHFGNYGGAHGGCRANWWQGAPCNSSPSPSYCGTEVFNFNSDRGSVRMQAGSSGRMNSYNYRYDRPGRCGQAGGGDNNFKLLSPGITGVFHRLEIEAQLTSEAACPSNAVYNNPPISPSLVGDGFARYYMTKSIDAGTPGTRTLIRNDAGILWFCKQDNVKSGRNELHKDSAPGANINGIWLNYYYGGSQGSLGEAWLWIRRLQFYVYP
jgi:hypothetical protein